MTSPPRRRTGIAPPTIEPERPVAPPAWWPWFLATLFAAALGWRLLVLTRLGGTPLLEYLSADAQAYWSWASEIRSGHWIPSHPFFLGPLYPYWLAVVRAFVGDRIVSVLQVQALLGAASVVLVTDATRRIATPRAAAATGVVLAGYAMTAYFDAQVLMESLLYFLMSLVLWLVVRGGKAAPMLVGTVFGVMALGRPVAVLVLLPYAALLASRPRRVPALAAAVAVPLTLILATGTFHLRTAQAWIPFTYSGGYNFYVGNGPEANGTYVPFADEYIFAISAEGLQAGAGGDGREYLSHVLGRPLSAGASSRVWFERAMAHVAASPSRFARLFVLKLGLLLNHRELPQLSDEATYDRIAGPLGWPPGIVFAGLAILAALGLPMAWRGGGERRVLIGAVAMLALGTAIFFVVDRYRVHMIPPLAMLAGVGLAHVATLRKARDGRGVLVSAGIAAVATAVVFAPLIPTSAAEAEWSQASTLGEAWLARGDAGRAAPWFERAVELDRGGELPTSTTPSARLSRAGIYENLGICYARLGDDERSVEALATAVELAPGSPSARTRYAEGLAMTGAWSDAAREYRAAGLSPREGAESLVRRVARERSGIDATRKVLEAAAGLLPSYEPAVIPLVRLEIAAGRLDSARVRLRSAERAGIDPHVVRAHLAWIASLEGDFAASRRLIESIPADVRTSDPRVAATLEQVRASNSP